MTDALISLACFIGAGALLVGGILIIGLLAYLFVYTPVAALIAL